MKHKRRLEIWETPPLKSHDTCLVFVGIGETHQVCHRCWWRYYCGRVWAIVLNVFYYIVETQQFKDYFSTTLWQFAPQKIPPQKYTTNKSFSDDGSVLQFPEKNFFDQKLWYVDLTDFREESLPISVVV